MTRSPGAARTVVLVHGAWAGGWCWREVAPILRATDARVSTPTLSGLGERFGESAHEIGLSTHVDDIVAHLSMEDLHDVDLVGWSYGGMVVTGVLATVPQRIRSIVYLDAFAPDDGRCLVDYSQGPSRATASGHVASRTPFPVRDPASMGATDPELATWCRERLRPQPWRAMVEPVRAPTSWPPHVSRHYVLCTQGESPTFRAFYEASRTDGRTTTHLLDAPHLAPLTHPVPTADVLLRAIGG